MLKIYTVNGLISKVHSTLTTKWNTVRKRFVPIPFGTNVWKKSRGSLALVLLGSVTVGNGE